jgi:hypothetical protein
MKRVINIGISLYNKVPEHLNFIVLDTLLLLITEFLLVQSLYYILFYFCILYVYVKSKK